MYRLRPFLGVQNLLITIFFGVFERLFLAVPRGCLQFVIVVFPDIIKRYFRRLEYGYLRHNTESQDILTHMYRLRPFLGVQNLLITIFFGVFERLFLAVPRGCLQFVIVVFPDHTQLLFFIYIYINEPTPPPPHTHTHARTQTLGIHVRISAPGFGAHCICACVDPDFPFFSHAYFPEGPIC